MAAIIQRQRWLTQPDVAVEIDRSHPLGKYAVAAFVGSMPGVRDACGNVLSYTGAGMYQTQQDGAKLLGHDGSANSVMYWVNKEVGRFDADDFLIYTKFIRKSTANSVSVLAKGDTGASEWMAGSSSGGAATQWRFYAGAGAVTPSLQTPPATWVTPTEAGAFRTGATCRSFIDGAMGEADTTSSQSLSDTTHHLSLFSGDWDGTTYDNTRIYAAEVEHVLILRGIGGEDVMRELRKAPYAVYKPHVERRYFQVAGGSAPTLNSLSISNITATSCRATVSLTR